MFNDVVNAANHEFRVECDEDSRDSQSDQGTDDGESRGLFFFLFVDKVGLVDLTAG